MKTKKRTNIAKKKVSTKAMKPKRSYEPIKEKVSSIRPKTKIRKAFDSLRKIGYVAEMEYDIDICGGLAKLPEGCEKYVFYTDQDAFDLKEYGSCYLSWNGDGKEIKQILEANGLFVKWDGNKFIRMEIAVVK